MEFESEQFFICPYCGQSISMLLEELYGAQSYIEDCETCCNPIQISYNVVDGTIEDLQIERIQ
jgi:hypothetical protein